MFSEDLIRSTAQRLHIASIENATIGEVLLLAQTLEQETKIPFIRMDQGSPSLPPNQIGIEAEKRALDQEGVNEYPAAAGIPVLKEAASEFVKAFLDVDISPRACIPTTGSVAASYGAFIAATNRQPGKDKVLFIDPGFPIQKSQLRLIGAMWYEFDVHDHRGAEPLRKKLESFMQKGDVAAIIYSNPNNPAWICFNDEELRVIADVATQYDVLVIEDLAYFGMDYRRQLCRPYEAPYVPTVAKYTDNYILLLSASKIFSYAGQRIATLCVSDALFDKHYPHMAQRFNDAGRFGPTLVASILYMITSGCTSSTQHAYAQMLRAATEGRLDFRSDVETYAIRATRMKEIFQANGFTVPYDKDVDLPVGPGFFFTLSYPGLTAKQLTVELLSYGISAISLETTGSEQQGVRACTARVGESKMQLLQERLQQFAADHQ